MAAPPHRACHTSRDDVLISFDEAVKTLQDELNYPPDKALHFIRSFDKNNDGKLSSGEFSAFLKKIAETKKTIVPAFKQYDRDNNGYINLQEAKAILQKDPFQFSPEKIFFLLKKFDVDANNKLDIDEFANFYAEVKATNDDLTERFKLLDKDGNGVLTSDEIICAIKQCLDCDEGTATAMVDMFDKNRDGTIDKTEFIQLWSSMTN